MAGFLSILITAFDELFTVAYRSLLLYFLYPLLANSFSSLPTKLPYITLFLIVFMLRLVFIDFNDIIDVRVVNVENGGDE